MQTILITGASSGIGKAFALDFAARGAQVILVARSESKLQEVAQEIEQKYHKPAHIITADLGKPNAANNCLNKLKPKAYT